MEHFVGPDAPSAVSDSCSPYSCPTFWAATVAGAATPFCQSPIVSGSMAARVTPAARRTRNNLFMRHLYRRRHCLFGTPVQAPWHFLYFLPLPQGQGSFRPTFGP